MATGLAQNKLFCFNVVPVLWNFGNQFEVSAIMLTEIIETDERADVICSLSMTLMTLEQVNDNSHYWKWVILSLHNAFQGAMVCHLSGSANLGACTTKSVTKWLEWYDGGENGTAPKLRLANPSELFERLSNESPRIEKRIGDEISTDQSHKKAFKLICELRNPFVHFQPTSWFIEVAGLPNMVHKILEMIESILQNGWAFRHANDAEKKELSALIEKIKKQVP